MSSADRVEAPPPALDAGPARETETPVTRGAGAAGASSSPSVSLRHPLDPGRVVRRALLVADLGALVVAFLTLQLIFPAPAADDRVPVDSELLLFAASLPAWALLARAVGLYDRDAERPEHTTVDDLIGIVSLVTMVVWLSFVASYVTGLASPDLGKWVYFWGIAIVAIAAARSLARALVRRQANLVQRALVVGTDRGAQLVGRKLLQHPEYRIALVGFVDAAPAKLRDEVAGVPVVGGAEDLPALVDELKVDRVVFGLTGVTDRQIVLLARHLQARGVQVDVVPRLYEALGPSATVTSIEAMQLVTLPPPRASREALALKRAFDILGSSVLLVLTAPLFAAIAAWIKLDSPGPVLFRQTRLGMSQRPFTALKFRTMRSDTSADVHREYVRRSMSSETTPEGSGLYKLERDDAVTRPGRLLRKTSLDELPQLINVLRGEMSLVGPRPCIPYETELFEDHHFERFSVPAGLTGLWQVTARARSPFVEALELDVLYARSWSFWGDIVLLLKTPVQVFRPKATR